MPRKLCKLYAAVFTILFVLSAFMTSTLAYTAVSEKINEISGSDGLSPKPQYVSVKGEKIWENIPDDYTLPDYVTIHIYANGEVCRTLQVKESDGWKYSVNALPKYTKDGNEIVYTVGEEPINGFFTKIEGYNIINRYIFQAAPVDIHVRKVWLNDSPENRPTSVEVRLLTDGKELSRITLTEACNWEYTWSQLDSSYTYSVDEPIVPKGYTSKTVQTDSFEFEVVNTLGVSEPTEETVTINGRKIWDHGIAPESARPAAVTVYIKNGNQIVREIIVTANDNWQYSAVLPKYDSNSKEIVYTVDEKSIPDYEKIIDGYNIKNTYIPKTHIIPNQSNNNSPYSPTPTGDGTNILLWIFVMILSGLASAVFIVRYNKTLKK